MSLIGRKVAVVSIGMCCQTSHQIRQQVELLKSLTHDDTLGVKALPFDSLICPPTSAASLIEADSRFPSDGELSMNVVPFWKEENVYFSHAFKNEAGEFDISARFQAFSDAFAIRWARFDSLKEKERVIFVVSNAQNSLVAQCRAYGTVSELFHSDQLLHLQATLSNWLGRLAELIVITRHDRFVETSCKHKLTVFHHDLDQSDWHGDDNQWAETLRKAVSGFSGRGPLSSRHLAQRS